MNALKYAVAAVSTAIAAAAFAAPAAHADGLLSRGEQALGDSMADEICDYLDSEGVTNASMTNLFNIVYEQREVRTPSNAVHVINYVVHDYCPGLWRELAAFGNGVRAANA